MRLAQVAQRVADLDRAVDFYTVLLAAEPVARFAPPAPPQAFFVLDGGTRLMLSRSRRRRCCTSTSTTCTPPSNASRVSPTS